MTENKTRHVWKWRDEDPEVIVLLVLFLVLILAVPWAGCGPHSTQVDRVEFQQLFQQTFEDLK